MARNGELAIRSREYLAIKCICSGILNIICSKYDLIPDARDIDAKFSLVIRYECEGICTCLCSQKADIIIAAIGKPDFVTADMVKEGAVIVDVGTTRVPDATRKSGFRLNGDVKFDEVAPKCSFITPVPGGVGPMTICSLMKNTLAAGKKEYYK